MNAAYLRFVAAFTVGLLVAATAAAALGPLL